MIPVNLDVLVAQLKVFGIQMFSFFSKNERQTSWVTQGRVITATEQLRKCSSPFGILTSITKTL